MITPIMKLSLIKALAFPLAAATASSDPAKRINFPATAPPADCAYPPGSGTDCPVGQFCAIPKEACGSLDPNAAIQGTCAVMPQACTADWTPVCGCDGKTYGNKCTARGAGVNVDYTGVCEGDYCFEEPDYGCWTEGLPRCCMEEDQPCPRDRVPRCDNNNNRGWNYCTWAPDKECYPANNGWPECCGRFDGTNCPPDKPNCENPPEDVLKAMKFLRNVN